MSIYDDLPDTEQGLKTFIMYGENQVKQLLKDHKRMILLIDEAKKRLEKINDRGK